MPGAGSNYYDYPEYQSLPLISVAGVTYGFDYGYSYSYGYDGYDGYGYGVGGYSIGVGIGFGFGFGGYGGGGGGGVSAVGGAAAGAAGELDASLSFFNQRPTHTFPPIVAEAAPKSFAVKAKAPAGEVSRNNTNPAVSSLDWALQAPSSTADGVFAWAAARSPADAAIIKAGGNVFSKVLVPVGVVAGLVDNGVPGAARLRTY